MTSSPCGRSGAADGIPARTRYGSRPLTLLSSVVATVAVILSMRVSAHAVLISVDYTDSSNEGFNDPARGAARRAALEFAADAWGRMLAGTVPIVVEAAMDSLGGAGSAALLASTGATTLHQDFPAAPLANVLYAAALANQLSRVDLNGPELSEIQITFNSDVDNPAILGSVGWYYGTDAEAGFDIDFVTIALHELGHGLGFFDQVDPGTGALIFDVPAVYDLQLVRPGVGGFATMFNAERLAAITSGDLFWRGPNVVGVHGTVAPIYAPQDFLLGSSLTHWDTSLSNELLAPFYTTPNHDPGLALAALVDMGWELGAASPRPTATPTPRGSPARRTPTRTPSPRLLPAATRIVAYVTNFLSDTVSVIDAATNRVTTAIPVGEGPLGVAIAPDGRWVYVATFHSNAVSVIDTISNSVVETIPVGGAANGVAVTPDGGVLYVTNTSPGTVAAVETGGRSVTETIPVGSHPAGLTITPDGSLVFVANFGSNTVSVIDTADNIVIATIVLDEFVARGPLGIAIASNGGFGYVTSLLSEFLFEINPRRLSGAGSVPLSSPEAVAITPDSAFAYVTNSREGRVHVLDTETNEVKRTVRVGDDPEGVAITPDGTLVYVTNTGSDTVSVIRSAANVVVDTVPVGAAPQRPGRLRQVTGKAPCVGARHFPTPWHRWPLWQWPAHHDRRTRTPEMPRPALQRRTIRERLVESAAARARHFRPVRTPLDCARATRRCHHSSSCIGKCLAPTLLPEWHSTLTAIIVDLSACVTMTTVRRVRISSPPSRSTATTCSPMRCCDPLSNAAGWQCRGTLRT